MKTIFMLVTLLMVCAVSSVYAEGMDASTKDIYPTSTDTIDAHKVAPQEGPNVVTQKDMLSSTGHKHDGQGTEDLMPRPDILKESTSKETMQTMPDATLPGGAAMQGVTLPEEPPMSDMNMGQGVGK